ncbi:hypothetical protein ES705_26784 [subsurface metagenome]
MSESNRNKHGLSRNIPRAVKREVRRRCGFGCVICGFAIYEYHHFDPPFPDAKEHNPNKIVILCGTCHDLEKRKRLSEGRIRNAALNPKCLENGFSHGPFYVDTMHPEVTFGSATYGESDNIISIDGESLINIDPPESEGSPHRLSGTFYNDEGKKIFKIKENEWIGPTENWDIEIEGPTLIIRRDHRKISLKLTVEPPKKIKIKRINMVHKGVWIYTNTEGNLIVERPGTYIECKQTYFNLFKDGLKITSDSMSLIPKPGGSIKTGGMIFRIGLVFECKKCGKCCKDKFFSATLTYLDILKIIKVYKLTPDEVIEILEVFTMNENEIGIIKENSRIESGLSFIRLRKLSNSSCFFYNKTNFTCKIYKFRPSSCRIFPFSYTIKNGTASFTYTIQKRIYCPGTGKDAPFINKDEWNNVIIKIISNNQKHNQFLENLKSEKENFSLRDLVEKIFTLT